MGKLIVGETRFLLLCALLLVLPSIAAAQCISQLSVQSVLTQDAGGNNKTTFTPGESIHIVAQINNGYGAYMLAANGAQIAVKSSFYNDTKRVDIPGGISPWTWDAVAPATQSSDTITVSAYDHFCGVFVSASASLTIGQSPLPSNLSFNVDSTKGWQTTSLKVTKGQQLSFSATGSWNVDYRNFQNVGPDGYSPEMDSMIYQGCKPESILPYGVLLVRIGDNDSHFIAIGSEETFTAYQDGFLEFRIHDTCLADNAGSVDVTVTMGPSSSGQPPVITLLGANPLNHTQGCPFIDPGATATDAEDGDVTKSIIVTGSVNIHAPGQYLLAYTVTDSSGRSDSETRQVIVSGVIGTTTCQPGHSPIYGESFGTVTDEQGLHHYVSFLINPPHIGNWRVEGPVPSLSPFGGTNPDPWPQTSPNDVRAGFHWPDPPVPDPSCCLKPSDYRLYPR